MTSFIRTTLSLRTLLLCLLFAAGSFKSQASHLAAADIYLDYIGNGTNLKYRLTLAVYKACEPGAIDLDTFTDAYYYTPSGCGNTDPIRIRLTAAKVDTLDKLCDTFKANNSCRNADSKLFAFVRHLWTYDVELTQGCTDWVFYWWGSARNSLIKNITGGNLYVDCSINNTKRITISTPRYTIDPIPYFCLNAYSIVNNGPYDPDGDEMVSANVTPRTGPPATDLTYLAGYSLINPIKSMPEPYLVDPTTCAATLRPTEAGKFALAYRTYKYDHVTGELLGYTTRDVQVSVLGCEAPPPDPDTLPKGIGGVYLDSAKKTVYACPGQDLRFTVGATSMSFVNAVYTDWDLSILPGARFESTGDGTHRSEGTLYWTPGKSDVGDHVLTLKFKDSTCSLGQPLITETYYVVNIRVMAYVDAGKDGIYCPPSGAAWTMQTKEVPGMRYKWSSLSGSGTVPPFMDNDTLPRPAVKPAVNSTYAVSGSVYFGPYRCTTHDTVAVNMGVPLITIDAGPEQTICANKSITLLSSVTPTSAMANFHWTSSENLDDSTKMQPVASPSVTKKYVLYAEDRNGCGFTDTTKVIVDGIQPNLAPFASRDTVCPEGYSQLYANVSAQACGVAQSSCTGGVPSDKVIGADAIPSTAPSPFNHTTNSGGERMQIMYRKDELMAAGLKAGFINSLAFNIPAKNTTDSFYQFTIKMACTGDDRMSGSGLTTYPGTAVVFPSRTVGTTMGWNTYTFPNAYYWDGASNLIVDICWSKVYGTYGGTADAVYCSNTTYTSVHYVGSYTIPAPAMGDGCSLNTSALLSSARPNTRFNVCITPSLFTYSWTPTTYLTQPDSANTEAVGINDDMVYNIKVTSASNPTCYSEGGLSMTVDRSNSVTALPASPYIVCRPGYVTLDAEGHGARPLRNIPCGLGTPITCASESEITVANPSKGSLVAEPTTHAFNGAYATSHTQYIIPRSALMNGKMTSGSINSISFETVGTSSMTFSDLKISLKCTDLEQFVNSDPSVFETGTVMVYNATTRTVGGGGYNEFRFNAPYNWDTTKNLLVDICYGNTTTGTGPTINAYNTQGFTLMCQSYQNSGDICVNPSTQIGPKVFESLPNFRVRFCSAGDTDFRYTWTPGEFMEDTTVKNPTLYVNSNTKVYVSTQGRNGCKVRDSVTLIIPENRRYITPDTAICLNESINLKSYNGSFTVWYEGAAMNKPTTLSCDSCSVTIAKPTAATDYYAVVWDENGCIDTFKVSVDVKSLPTIMLANQDTTIKYGSSVALRVFGGTQYYWYPLAGLTNPNAVNPVARPLITTVYTVVGLGMNGCRNTDSVKVTIDFRSPIGVPNAFSPNGDGKNDKFQLVGTNFQTLMEFRVFNRWGQEVFSTTDINGGWDGTWKGQPQDMGVYNYLIRVGYPDGYTETYKGDVTLVR